MHFLDQYPVGLAPQKPQQTITAEALQQVLPHAVTTKKYNGNRCAVLIGSNGNVRIFSRNGTLEWTASLPLTCNTLKRLQLPLHTFLDCELYVPQDENVESVQRIVNSGNPVKGAQAEALLQPALAVFDLLFLQGHALHTTPLHQRLQLLQALLPKGDTIHRAEDVAIRDFDHALELVSDQGWEGLVVARRDAPNAINFRGHTKRGQLWKIKIRHTEDMIAVAAKPSKDPSLGVGTLQLLRRVQGQWIPAGKVGSFDAQFDRHAAMGSHNLPIVVEVSHFGQDERGNLEFPKVCRRRMDLEIELLSSLPQPAHP